MRQQKNESFCNRLQWLMDGSGVSAVQLSREVGVSHVAVGNWLRGAKPRPKVIKNLAEYFGCSVQFLLYGKGEPPDFIPEKSLPVVMRETAGEYQVVDPWVNWSKQLRAAWKKDQAKVELAVRAAWPKTTAEEIIAWLANATPAK